MIKNLRVENVDCLHGTIVTVNNFNDAKDVFEMFNGKKDQFDYLKESGEVLGYYTDRNIVGILSLIDGKNINPLMLDNPEKMIYLSNIVVREPYQGRGYARDLLNYFMHYFEGQDYYDEAYYKSNGIVTNRLMIPYGFKPMESDEGYLSKKRGYIEPQKRRL